MEIAIIALEIVLIIVGTVAIFMLCRLSKGLKEKGASDINGKLESEIKSLKETLVVSNKATVDALQTGMKSTNEPIIQLVQTMARVNEQRIGEMKEQLGASLKEMKEEIEKNLGKVREDNARQLEAIRGTVDEKLTKTLDERLNASFKNVSDSLEKLYKNLGELKTLDANIMDLNKVINGSKTRGIWGELSLEALLEEILTPQQFERQSKMGRRSSELVDFAVVLPGPTDGEKVYLPIDSKFPIEAFVRMDDALKAGDAKEYERSRKELINAIKTQAGFIKKKYIAPPQTTDFAIMYLPVESLYAEVLRADGLADELQRNYRVIVSGPVNIAALLNSLRVGFKTLQIQKNSNEVFKLLTSFRKDFETFFEEITRAQKQMETAQNTLDKAAKRTETINKTLAKVEGLKGFDDEGEDEPPKLI